MNWRGDEVTSRVLDAAAYGINHTMGDCVRYAQANHPGWKNITSTAQNSIRIQRHAYPTSLYGEWGSTGVNYFRYLEKNHGNALQNSADVNYRLLPVYIRKRFTK